MASLCKRQQCTVERRGLRQELDSWRHKLIHCVGFESILEGLFGSRLVDEIALFQDCEPQELSDWSLDENCLFCCSRREKKVKPQVEDGQVERCEEQSRVCLERQAQDFLNAVLHRKELPGFSDPQIPLVAREIMQRMIRQFAAEYTSKTTQEAPPPAHAPAKDQSLLPRAPSLAPAPGVPQGPQGPRPLSPLALPLPEPSSPSPSSSSSSSSSSSASSPSPGHALSPGSALASGTPAPAVAPVITGTPALSPLFPGTPARPETPALAPGAESPGASGGASAGANGGGPKTANTAPAASSAATANSASSAATAAASAQNPVLSKLLMADQDGPLDLTVRRSQEEPEPTQQDGVLDLSTKKHHGLRRTSPGLSASPGVKGVGETEGSTAYAASPLRPARGAVGPGRASRDPDQGDGPPPRGLQDGRRDVSVSSASLKPPLARSLVIKDEFRSQKHRLLNQPAALSLANLESVGLLNNGQPHAPLSREGSGSSWGGKARLDNLLKLKQASGALCGALSDLKELPLFLENHHHHNHHHHGHAFSSKSSAHQHHHGHLQISKAYHHHNHDSSKREQGHSPPVDLKIPQVRGVDLSWESHASDLYGYGPMGLGGSSLGENALSRKLRAILPKQNRRGGLGGLLEGASDYWSSSELDHPGSGPAYSGCDLEGDSVSKQPRKKRGRYRQYNTEILEEAIGVVMTGKMSVSKAQNIYGIPHSTLEYKVKERMGTLKNPPKKKLKLMMRGEGGPEGGPDSAPESENTPTATPTATPTTTPREDAPPLAAGELADD